MFFKLECLTLGTVLKFYAVALRQEPLIRQEKRAARSGYYGQALRRREQRFLSATRRAIADLAE